MKTIFERVRELNLPLGQYVVVGGGMEAAGIRKANDVDIVAKPKLFNELIEQGWSICDCEKCKESGERVLKKDDVDVYAEYRCGDKYKANIDEIIANADIIEGLPFLQMSELVKWKTASGRPKDLNDIKLVEDYLAQREDS